MSKVVSIDEKKNPFEDEARKMAFAHLITKIKVDKKFYTMLISYTGASQKFCKTINYQGYDEMLLDKYLVIQSLKEKVCEMLDFPMDWSDEMCITGISFNYDEENDNALRGMVVTLQKEVDGLNCPLNINTPFIKFSKYVENYSAFPSDERQWNDKVRDTVADILMNAYMYMCGETKHIQEKMF